MNKLLKYLICLSILSLMIGPLGAIPFGIPQVNVYLTDILIGLIGLTWIINFKQAIRLIQNDSITKYFCGFVFIATISLVFSPLNINISEKFISGLYLVRLFSYFFVYLTVKKLIREKVISGESIIRLLIIAGLILAGLGWLQYFLYPDLRNLYYLGWDPHFKRIFSTFLDPNYFGLILVLMLIALFTSPLSSPVRRGNKIGEVIGKVNIGFIFATLMFTYSRSSFLALVGAIIYLSIVKGRFKLLVGILLLLLISALLLPRPGGAGVQLERVFSIEKRIENWQQAVRMIYDHPLLGVGFNTVRYAKNLYNFGQDNLSANHAGAGWDNSFLFIGATTGILGLGSFIIFLRKIFQGANILVTTSLIAIIVHSLFLNSLFFPWVMLWMWIIIGTCRDPSIRRVPYGSPSSSG